MNSLCVVKDNAIGTVKTNIINCELYIIHVLQKYLILNHVNCVSSYNKYLTSLNSIILYLSFILYHDTNLFMYIVLSLYTSRTTNRYIKNYCKKERPYNRNPGYIKYFIKRKQSYSFPSQSILNISVFYNTLYYYNVYNDYVWFNLISYVYYLLFASLSITRMYRGLHYPHDIIISYLYSIFVAMVVMQCV